MKINLAIETFTETYKKHIFIGILCFYCLIFCSISLVNHYFFRSWAYDLGIYNNQMYHYLHFDLGNTVIYPNMTNKWADHFSVFQIIFSPFYYIFGSATLLVAQIVFVLLGGVACHKIIFHLTKNNTLSLIGLCHFYSLWGIYSALSFDYHDNVIGSMILPWLIYFFMKNQFFRASITLISILLCKETMGLWMIFVSIFLFFFSENPRQRKFALVAIAFSALYFYVVFFQIIPTLNIGFSYKHFKYSFFGSSFSDMGKYLIQHPIESIKYLFRNHTGVDSRDGIKFEFWYMFLLSGGFVIIRYPKFIIAYLPILLMKMYNDSLVKWGINVHYSIETVPILSVALFYFISKIKGSFKVPIAFSVLLLTISLTLLKLYDRTSKSFNKPASNFLITEHYTRESDVKKLHDLLKTIGDDEKISATAPIVPWLSFREHIYTFPYLGEADKVILNIKLGCWPMERMKIFNEIKKLEASKNWKLTYQEGDNYIFERVGPNELHIEDDYEFH